MASPGGLFLCVFWFRPKFKLSANTVDFKFCSYFVHLLPFTFQSFKIFVPCILSMFYGCIQWERHIVILTWNQSYDTIFHIIKKYQGPAISLIIHVEDFCGQN